MEAYSKAYVHAVAAAAGVSIGRMETDSTGLDIMFQSDDDPGSPGSTAHVQLKSTADALSQAQGGIGRSYPLRVKDYNHLILASRIPRLLVVLEIPKDPDDWLDCNPEHLLLNATATWVKLTGKYGPTTNTSTVSIELPPHQHFTPEALLANLGSLAL